MYPNEAKHLTKHFNKIRSRKAAVTPPNIFTVTGIFEAYVFHASHIPVYLQHIAAQAQRREYNKFSKLVKEVHDEFCGCKKFAICRRTTGHIQAVKNGMYYDDHDITYSNDYCLQCKNLELIEFHLMMLNDKSYTVNEEKTT